MKIRLLPAAVLAAAAVLFLASFAWAQPMTRMGGSPGHQMGPGMPMAGGPMAAGLTPDQQQAMERIVNAHKASFAKLDQRLWAKRTQLQAVLTEDRIDEARVKALTGEINRLRSDLFTEQVAMQVELAKAGLSSYTLRGRGMMGPGMMGGRMDCPMMGEGDGSGPGD